MCTFVNRMGRFCISTETLETQLMCIRFSFFTLFIISSRFPACFTVVLLLLQSSSSFCASRLRLYFSNFRIIRQQRFSGLIPEYPSLSYNCRYNSGLIGRIYLIELSFTDNGSRCERLHRCEERERERRSFIRV